MAGDGAFRIGSDYALLLLSEDALPYTSTRWSRLRPFLNLTNGALAPLLSLTRSEAARGNAYAINALAWQVLYGIGDVYDDCEAAADERRAREDAALLLSDVASQQHALYDLAMDTSPDMSPYNVFDNAYVAVPLFALSVSLGCVEAQANLLSLQLRRVPAACTPNRMPTDPGLVDAYLDECAHKARNALWALCDTYATDTELAMLRVLLTRTTAWRPFDGTCYYGDANAQHADTLKWLRAPPLCVDAVNQKRVPTRALMLYSDMLADKQGVALDVKRSARLSNLCANRNDLTEALQDHSIVVGPFWMHRKRTHDKRGDAEQWMALLRKAADQPDGAPVWEHLAHCHMRGMSEPQSPAARLCPRDTLKAQEYAERALRWGGITAPLNMALGWGRRANGDLTTGHDFATATRDEQNRCWAQCIQWHRRNTALHPLRCNTQGYFYAPGLDLSVAHKGNGAGLQPPKQRDISRTPWCGTAAAALFLQSASRPLPGSGSSACVWGDADTEDPTNRRDDFYPAAMCWLYSFGDTPRHVLRGVEHLRFCMATQTDRDPESSGSDEDDDDDDDGDEGGEGDEGEGEGADAGEGEGKGKRDGEGDGDDAAAPCRAGGVPAPAAVPRPAANNGAAAGAAAGATGAAAPLVAPAGVNAADAAAIAAAQADVDGDGDAGAGGDGIDYGDGYATDEYMDDDVLAARELRRMRDSTAAMAEAQAERLAIYGPTYCL